MTTTLLIYFCLVIRLHAEYSNTSTTSTSFSLEGEYSKISTTCFSSRDYELLLGDFIKHTYARSFSSTLLEYSVTTIGLAELRKALNFGPVRPWTHYKYEKPTKQELESATSLEDYYNLIEPIAPIQSLDSLFFFEKTINIAVDYLDKRLPSIRNIFRRRFEEKSKGTKNDRKLVDIMIDEWRKMVGRILEVIDEMRENDTKCWD
ncbi:hypothetical protein GCK72_024120 [Caenorhabditis remanei]|uniref:Domain of unknown function WSN domain-containing protein n=1 Tax=Caenorhabditis remanei TaxID=31234 RepID=A0A6A5FYY3_CAERE|nr:hypothetical protein GCK72_024120 [Caenorhabditis remanei]KAF1747654.1 hypothetical protein GCK72_024120 [Caenorhabditis remanei]